MEIPSGHPVEIKHQAADAFSQLPITWEDCNPIHYVLPLTSVALALEYETKGRLKPHDITDDYDNISTASTFQNYPP